MKSLVKTIAFCFLAGIFLAGCENPVSLGSKVNTLVPVISIPDDPSSQPGTFLQGSENIIFLDVEQEFGIDSVFMIIEYVDKNDKQTKNIKVPAYYDRDKGCYAVNVDTSNMTDGRIKTWVTAVDSSGKSTTTTDMIYLVKNLPPQIKLTMPVVEDNDFDDDNFLGELKNNDPLYLGFELMGLATDDYGIAKGYPMIMIWPDSLVEGADLDDDHLPIINSNGEAKDGRYGTWRSLLVSNPGKDVTTTKFSWPMVNLVSDSEAPGGWRLPEGGEPRTSLSPAVKYRFRIMIKDLFGNVNYYPDRSDTTRAPGNPSPKYMEISYIAANVPIIQVTEGPRYYNAAKDFALDLLVSSSNPIDSSDPVTAYITTNEKDGTEKTIAGPYSVVSMSSSSSPYRFKLIVTAAQAALWDVNKIPSSGLLCVRLKAKDIQGKSSPDTYHDFNYDVTPPEVAFDRPTALTEILDSGELTGGTYTIYYPHADRPKWVTGNITVGGSSKDDFGIKEVWYHIGKLGDDSMTDAQRKALYDNDANWENTNLHSSSPAPNWSGSIYAWNYTCYYNIGYKSQNTGLVQEFDDLKGYTGLNSDTLGKERFYLPFYVKVVDNADNRRVIHYTLCIDPLLDEPQVTITYPDDKENNLVGGTVRLSGIACDNFWMHTVLIRIKKDGASGYYIPSTTPPTLLFYSQPEYSSYPVPRKSDGFTPDKDGWFKAVKIGDDMVVNWYHNINQDGGLNPPPPGDSPVKVTIEAVGIDTNEITHQTPHITGPIEKLDVYFSSKVPTIEEVKIVKGTDAREYNEGIKTSGKFNISMKIGANGGINTVLARVNNASSWVNVITEGSIQTVNPAWSVTPPAQAASGRYESTLTVTVDSAKTNPIVSGLAYGNTGSLFLEVQVEDSTTQKFTTNGSYNIGIDNFYPTAKIETPRIASDDPNNADASKRRYFMVQGTAQDWGTGSGSIQALERVLVYFEKAQITYPGGTRTVSGTGDYLRPNGPKGAIASAGDMEPYPDVMDTTLPGWSAATKAPNAASFAKFPKLSKNSGGVWTSPVALVIDYPENDPAQDYDGDGTFGEMWNGLLDKIWGARVKLEYFDDGPLMVHYIVMDQAGNATHYSKDIYIENNKPRIKDINFGTDIDGSGTSVYGDNPYDLSRIDSTTSVVGNIDFDPAFRIRGSRFSVKLNVEKGNGTKKAALSYVTAGAATTAANIRRGNVYTILTPHISTDFTKYGAPNNFGGTTFVASDDGDASSGTGTIRQYVPGNSVTAEPLPGSGIINFTGFSGIPDSIKTAGEITAGNHNQRFFIVKVYDTTVSSPTHGNPNPVLDQLADAVLVALDIDNNDQKPPTIAIAPFGKKFVLGTYDNLGHMPDSANDKDKIQGNVTFYTDNIARSSTGERLGYVQYAEHSGGAANISGRVIFTGKAEDNQRIQNIYVTIPGYNGGAKFPIAGWSGGSFVPIAATGLQAGNWEFKILENRLTLEHGHALNWEFIWDSSKHANVAANNVTVTFEASDFASTPGSAASSIPVNIVPYISVVETPLSGANKSAPSAFNRSALGGYPVREGDIITIRGFNFGTSTATINGSAAFGTNTGGTAITGAVPAAAASGPLVVTVNSIPSINNSTNKTAAYNQEPNGVNNDILDNSRYMYVWTAGYMLNRSPADITSPFFRMDTGTGARYITFGYYGPNDANTTQSSLRMLVNNGDGRAWADTTAARAGTFGRQLATTNNRYIGISNAIGTNGEFYVISSNQTQGGSPFNLYTSNALASGAAPAIYTTQIAATSNPGRFEIPRIWAKSGGGAAAATASRRVVMGYFDNDRTNLYIRYGSRGAADNNTWAGFTERSVTAAASKYSAVGALYNGRPVAAYYYGSSLVFAYGTTYPANTTQGTTNCVDNPAWTTVTIPNTVSKGAHVDLAVDPDDNVHLAYYDVANGGLYYLLIPASGAQAARTLNTANLNPVRVDTYQAAGTKIMLNIRTEGTRHVPYITYFHGSFTETRNSIRVAWRKDFTGANYNGTDDKDMFTGKWEVMTVPAINTPLAAEIICNGVPTVPGDQAGTRWYDVNTHGTGGSPLARKSVDLSKSIVIGYMTDQYYEGAILKDDMTTGLLPK